MTPAYRKRHDQPFKKNFLALFQVHSVTTGVKSPQDSCDPIYCAKGPFFHALRRGSLTVEAALAAPLFLFCVIALICMMDMYGLYVKQLVNLQVQAEQAGAAAAAVGTGPQVIDLCVPAEWTVPGFGVFGGHVRIACRARVRPWTGRDPSRSSGADPEADRLVYVTEHGRVYHTDSSCTHIDLSLHAVSSASLPDRRNADGGHYHACEKCVGSGGVQATVFITEEGDCYHNTAGCSGLKRSVHLVPLSEAGELPVCSRCRAGGGG